MSNFLYDLFHLFRPSMVSTDSNSLSFNSKELDIKKKNYPIRFNEENVPEFSNVKLLNVDTFNSYLIDNLANKYDFIQISYSSQGQRRRHFIITKDNQLNSMGKHRIRKDIDLENDKDNKCSICNGEGFVLDYNTNVYQTCTVCKGKGYISF